MFKRKKKKTGIQTPEYSRFITTPESKLNSKPNPNYVPPASTKPPKPPTTGSNAVKSSPVQVYDIGNVEIMCHYETPCGWCCKWDKKCDKKIGCDDNKPQRGLRAKDGIFLDYAATRNDAQEVIETIKSGKLPPLNKNNTYGLETRG